MPGSAENREALKRQAQTPAQLGQGDRSATSPSGLARIVVRGASIAGAGFGLTQAISLATYLALARLLRPSDIGAYAAASVLIMVGLVIGESGMMAALIRRRDRVEEAFNTAFLASIGMGFGLALAAVAAAPLVGLVFHSYTVAVMSAVMAGTMVLRLALIVPSARFQRNFSFMRRAVLDPLGALLFGASAVAASLSGLGPWSLVIGTYAQFAVDVIVSWTMSRWRPRPHLASRAMWREIARFGRPVFAANLISRASAQVPVIAVGRILGAATLGQLSYAVRVGTQPVAAMVDVGAYTLLPAFSRISEEPARLRAALLRTLRWACAVAFPLGLLLVPLGTPAVVLVFGAKWRPAGHATMALGVYCAALCFGTVAAEVWKAAGRPGMLPRMQGLGLVLTILLVAVAAPFGLVPVAAALAVSAILVAAYAVHGMGKVVGIEPLRLAREVAPPAISALTMAAVLFVSEHLVVHSDSHSTAVGAALLVGQALLGVVIYLSCLTALSPNCRRDLAGVVRRGRRPRVPQMA
jgi:PST family polysaccharide transporter